jgi:hypothetical protein
MPHSKPLAESQSENKGYVAIRADRLPVDTSPGVYCHLFQNVDDARCPRHRNKYVSTETNGVDLKHFEKALTPFDHTSSIATIPIRLETGASSLSIWHTMRGLSNDEQHLGSPPQTAHARAAIADRDGMIASTALGMFVPPLFTTVAREFKVGHVTLDAPRDAYPTPETMWP